MRAFGQFLLLTQLGLDCHDVLAGGAANTFTQSLECRPRGRLAIHRTHLLFELATWHLGGPLCDGKRQGRRRAVDDSSGQLEWDDGWPITFTDKSIRIASDHKI